MSAKRAEALNRCPNCGAPLDLDPAGRCRWCEVPVNVLTSGSPSSTSELTETFRVATAPRAGRRARGLIVALIVGGFAGLAVILQLNVGRTLFGIRHESDLTIAWTAPSDSSSDLTTVGAWVNGGSLVRIRVDEVVSYDGATGRPQWTLPIPGTDVACSISNDTGTGGTGPVGLVMYGQDSITCDHVMAVDLGTGRQLWATPLHSSYSGDSALGALGVAGGTAVVLTDDGIIGLNVRSGANRWTRTSECGFEQLAGSGGTAVALSDCGGTSNYVVSIDPATGKVAWRHKIAEPSDSYEFRILSASPVVISDNQIGPRATIAEVRVFGPGGAVTATFSVAGIHDPAAGGPLTLDTEPTDGFGFPEVIAGGALVGVAQDNSGHSALVAFGLSSGKRQWVVPLPDAVNDITAGGRAQHGEVVLVDESDPAYSLEEVDIATGKLRSLGSFGQQALDSGDSGLYAVGSDYLVVNLNGAFNNPPIAAIKAPAATG
jgi:outer membrane protein assembly factor BamB